MPMPKNEANVYQRLASARKRFKEAKIQKGGKNAFQGYTYFELSDILNALTDINTEVGLVTSESITNEEATLVVINVDKPDERIEFSVPMSTAQLKGCHPVQNLGAAITYVRRYLYQNAFSIAEPDQLDSGKQPKEEKPVDKSNLCERTQFLVRQKNFVNAVLAKKGWEAVLKGFDPSYTHPEKVREEDWNKVWKALEGN